MFKNFLKKIESTYYFKFSCESNLIGGGMEKLIENKLLFI